MKQSSSALPSHQFLYEGVFADLKHRVTAGEWEIGAFLPSREELSQHYGVSGITLRRAIKQLATEGYLLAKPGLGMVVQQPMRVTRRLSNRLRTETLGGANANQTIRVLNIRPAEQRDAAAARSRRSGSKVMLVERLILVERGPVSYDKSFLERSLLDLIEDHLEQEYMVALLLNRGVAITHRKLKIRGQGADAAHARHLNVEIGFPLLATTFELRDSSQAPVLWGESFSRSDRLEYSFDEPLMD